MLCWIRRLTGYVAAAEALVMSAIVLDGLHDDVAPSDVGVVLGANSAWRSCLLLGLTRYLFAATRADCTSCLLTDGRSRMNVCVLSATISTHA